MEKRKKEMLAQAHPITRKWLISLLKNQEISVKVEREFIYLNTVEGNIYKAWHQDCLSEMKRIKLNTCVPDLFEFVADPKVNLAKALSTAQKLYAKEENKTRQKHIGKMVALLQGLSLNEKKLYKETTEALSSGEKSTCIERIAKEISTANEVTNEYRLYTKQSIKHYNRLVKLGRKPSVHELYQALDPRSAADPNIHTAQVNIVSSTYTKGCDVPNDIKDVCFDYIRESIKYAGYFHVVLMEYIFKNDTISERAFNLFTEAENVIRHSGMAIMPKMYAHRLAKKKGLYDKQAVELSDSDLRILKIEQMFS